MVNNDYKISFREKVLIGATLLAAATVGGLGVYGIQRNANQKYDALEQRLNLSQSEVKESKVKLERSAHELKGLEAELDKEFDGVMVDYPEYSFDQFDSIIGPKLKEYSEEQKRKYFDSLDNQVKSIICTSYKEPVKAFYGASNKPHQGLKDYAEGLTEKDFEKIKEKFPWIDRNNLTLGDLLTIFSTTIYENSKDRLLDKPLE